MSASSFPPVIQSIFEEFIPICKQIAGDQRYAISVGGSLGKGTWDSRSDIDFRLFTDREVPRPKQRPELWADCTAAIERWKERGIDIDGVWPRTVGEIDAALDGWLGGEIKPVNLVWTIWGYHILTDVNNQFVIEDPYQHHRRLERTPERLSAGLEAGHPEQIRGFAALLAHGLSLRQQGRARRCRLPGGHDLQARA